MTVGLLTSEPTLPASCAASAALALRLKAGSRAGHTIRWTANHCCLGSGPNATLRLRAAGIAARHCLIVRETAGTSIQRLADITLLNGQTFETRLLSPGDLLRVGSLEFEVVEEFPPTASEGVESLLGAGDRNEQNTTIKSIAADPEASSDRNEFQQPPSIAEPPNPALAGFAPLAIPVDVAAVYARLDQLEQALADCQHEGLQHNSQLEQTVAALVDRPIELPDDLVHAGQLNQVALDLNAAISEISLRIDAALQAAGSGWQSRCDQLGGDLSTLHTSVAERLEPIERILSELRNQSEELFRERHDYQRQVIRLQAQWIERADQLNAQLAAFDERLATLENLRGGITSAEPGHERSDQIDHRLAELRAEREAFEQEHRLHGHEPHGPATDHSRQMTQRLAEIQAERESLEWERRDHEAPLPERDDPPEAASDVERELEARLNQLRTTLITSHDDNASSPVERQASPDYDLDDSAPLPYRRDEQLATAAETPAEVEHALVDHEPDPRADESAMDMQRPTLREPARAVNETDAGAAEADDESIDDYMARLMLRVRGAAGSSLPPPSPSPSRPKPQTEATSSNASKPAESKSPGYRKEEVPPVEPELPKLEKLAQRSAPPERTANLSAMRDLANLTARTAIDVHSRRTLSRKTYSKLLVSVVGLGAGFTLACHATSGDLLPLLGSAFSTLMGFAWGFQFFALARRQVGTLPAMPAQQLPIRSSGR